MKLTRSTGQTGQGPADWFTGTVFINTVRNPDVSQPSAAPMCASHPVPVKS
jgi:hypothetical protein